jgi:hypothetical protein
MRLAMEEARRGAPSAIPGSSGKADARRRTGRQCAPRQLTLPISRIQPGLRDDHELRKPAPTCGGKGPGRGSGGGGRRSSTAPAASPTAAAAPSRAPRFSFARARCAVIPCGARRRGASNLGLLASAQFATAAVASASSPTATAPTGAASVALVLRLPLCRRLGARGLPARRACASSSSRRSASTPLSASMPRWLGDDQRREEAVGPLGLRQTEVAQAAGALDVFAEVAG